MTPRFAEAVDRIFLHVLGLLERIERDETISVSEERVKIRGWIDQAEAMLGQGQDWQLAKYALVAWIDEVLIEANWDGRTWWNENALEQEFFSGRKAFSQFYLKAKEASALPRKDALEVFYVCAVLGFRGMYRDPVDAAAEAEIHGLPPDLEAWAKQTSMAIQLGQGRPPITDNSMPGEGAPPLESQAVFVSYLLIGVALAALNLIVGWAFFVR